MTTPDLQPIRDAFKAADMIAGEGEKPTAPVEPAAIAPGKKKSKKSERDKDAAEIVRIAKTSQARAYAFGRACGWSDVDVTELLTPKPPPKASADASRTSLDDASERGDRPAAGAGGDGGWTPAKDPVKALPPDCPVRPLGVYGNTFFYLGPLNQLRELTAKDHSAMGLRDLFSPRIDYLWQTFPKFSASTGNQDGWKADRAAESLINACGHRGMYDGNRRVRGIGAWRADDGSLVLHAGDGVYVDGAWRPPGEHGGYLYPGYPATPRPADNADGYARLFGDLLTLFDSWNWQSERDPETGDPMHSEAFGHKLHSVLVLGWIGLAIVGGALDWRALIWISGDAGTGKSTLLNLIMSIVGDMVKSADATPAGVWTELGNSTRGVLLDEAENDPDSPRTKNLVALARKASSGDKILRGSANHEGAQFECRSSFLFSSIIIPPMLSQDVSRFAILDLGPLGDAKAIKADPVRNAAIGGLLRRRIVDHWDRWPDVLEAWRASLAAVGHSARGADQFGSLLAMADLLLADELAHVDLREPIAACFRQHAEEARSAAASNAGNMLNYLITVPIDAFRGGNKHTVGELVSTATISPGQRDDASPEGCEKVLRTWGIFIERDTQTFEWMVTLPNHHEALRRLFEGSQWRAAPGTAGGWSQAMRRLPAARQVNSRRLGGRGWSVPVDVFLLRENGN